MGPRKKSKAKSSETRDNMAHESEMWIENWIQKYLCNHWESYSTSALNRHTPLHESPLYHSSMSNVSKDRNGTLKVDLHTHSTHSDGKLTPMELIARAAQQGVRALALTDHDTMAGVMAATEAGIDQGVRVIPGVEISATTSISNMSIGCPESVHILGYFGPGSSSNLQELEATLSRIRQGRYYRALNMVEKLKQLGIVVKWERILQIAGEGTAPGRPHVAQALLEAGHVENFQQAFTKYIGDGRPAYSRGAEILAQEAVELICRAGGVAVLAHPWTLSNPANLLPRLKKSGLAGLEVYSTSSNQGYYAALALEHKLHKLGGSDYHGIQDQCEKELGSVNVPAQGMMKFLLHCEKVWMASLKE